MHLTTFNSSKVSCVGLEKQYCACYNIYENNKKIFLPSLLEGNYMISWKYDINDLFCYIRNTRVKFLVDVLRKEIYCAEQQIQGGRKGSVQARLQGCEEYVNYLKGFVFFLKNAIVPTTVPRKIFCYFLETLETMPDINIEQLEKIKALAFDNN